MEGKPIKGRRGRRYASIIRCAPSRATDYKSRDARRATPDDTLPDPRPSILRTANLTASLPTP